MHVALFLFLIECCLDQCQTGLLFHLLPSHCSSRQRRVVEVQPEAAKLLQRRKDAREVQEVSRFDLFFLLWNLAKTHKHDRKKVRLLHLQIFASYLHQNVRT